MEGLNERWQRRFTAPGMTVAERLADRALTETGLVVTAEQIKRAVEGARADLAREGPGIDRRHGRDEADARARLRRDRRARPGRPARQHQVRVGALPRPAARPGRGGRGAGLGATRRAEAADQPQPGDRTDERAQARHARTGAGAERRGDRGRHLHAEAQARGDHARLLHARRDVGGRQVLRGGAGHPGEHARDLLRRAGGCDGRGSAVVPRPQRLGRVGRRAAAGELRLRRGVLRGRGSRLDVPGHRGRQGDGGAGDALRLPRPPRGREVGTRQRARAGHPRSRRHRSRTRAARATSYRSLSRACAG